MKRTILMFLLGAAATCSALTEALTYRGVLSRPGVTAARREALTFTLYDSRVPEVALWQRMIPVQIALDGAFYTELADAVGTIPAGGPTNALAFALAQVTGTPEIGLTPEKGGEFPVRQRISSYTRAARAKYARAAERVATPSFSAARASANDFTVTNRLTVGGMGMHSKPIVPDSGMVVFEGDGAITLLGGVHGVRTVPWAASAPTAFSSSHDVIFTCQSADGVFNLVLPAGTSIVSDDGKAQPDVRVLSAQSFGPLP